MSFPSPSGTCPRCSTSRSGLRRERSSRRSRLPMSSDARVHPSALAFQRAVADYERGRPEFPDRAIGFLVDRLSLAPDRTLVELGAGTGKLTGMLAPSGVRIIAVEPLEAMREALSRNLPDVEVLDAAAEDLPLGEIGRASCRESGEEC